MKTGRWLVWKSESKRRKVQCDRDRMGGKKESEHIKATGGEVGRTVEGRSKVWDSGDWGPSLKSVGNRKGRGSGKK